MKCIHSGECSDGAAQNGDEEQRFFRNPPEMLFGLVFVDAHQGKAEDVYEDEIDKNDF